MDSKFKRWTKLNLLRHAVRTTLLLTFVVSGSVLVTGEVAAQVNKRATLKLLVKKAEEARKSEDFSAAGAIWLQIYIQAPSQPMSLYNAALMEEKAGDLKASAKHFREFLSVTTRKHPRYTLAKVRLQAVAAQMQAAEKTALAEQLLAERKATRSKAKRARNRRANGAFYGEGSQANGGLDGAVKADAARSDATTRSRADAGGDSPHWVAWPAIGVGGVLGAVAGGLYFAGVSDYDAATADLKARKLTLAEANQRISDLQTNDIVYGVVGGVGLLAVGVGVYLLLTSKKKNPTVTLAPWIDGRGRNGVVAAWRF